MKTIMLPITGTVQTEVLRIALEQMRESVESNLDALDHEDEGEADNVEAFEKEMLAIDSMLDNLRDAVEAKIVVVIEGGLVADVFCSHAATVFVADRDVENDGRDIGDDALADLIADLKEVY